MVGDLEQMDVFAGLTLASDLGPEFAAGQVKEDGYSCRTCRFRIVGLAGDDSYTLLVLRRKRSCSPQIDFRGLAKKKD